MTDRLCNNKVTVQFITRVSQVKITSTHHHPDATMTILHFFNSTSTQQPGACPFLWEAVKHAPHFLMGCMLALGDGCVSLVVA
jgi:hypothetical protein